MPSYDTDHCAGPQDVGQRASARRVRGDLKTKLAAGVDDMVLRQISRLTYVSSAHFV